MVTQRKESQELPAEVLDIIRPYLTPDFVSAFRKAGQTVGYRNLGRAIALSPTLAAVPNVTALPKRETKSNKATKSKAVTKSWSLLDAVKVAAKVAAKRSAIPIATHILIEPVSSGRVRVAATDLETFVSSEADCDYTGQAVAVPASELVAALRSHKDVALSGFDKGTLQVRSAAGETRISGREAKDFPPLPNKEFSTFVTLEGLANLAAWASVVAASDDSRPVLGCVCIGSNGGLGASDGFRLRQVGDNPCNDYVLLRKEAVKHIPADASVIERSSDLAWLRIPGEHFTLYSMATQGTFPNYEAIIPREFNEKVTVTLADFRAALDSVRQIARDGSGIVRLAATPEGSLAVSAVASEIGEARQEIAAEVTAADTGNVTKIAFNLAYLDDACKGATGDRLTLGTNGHSNTGRFDFGDASRIEVIMPMFVQW